MSDGPPRSLGLPRGTVRVDDYDPEWSALFVMEVSRIARTCDGLDLDVEHVGSTAVPGLCAKPVVDLLVGRRPTTDVELVIQGLKSAGYVHRGNLGLPGREFLRRGNPSEYHVHLVEVGGEHWLQMLRFRDRLRSSPDVMEQYAALKRSLALRYPQDRESYLAGKAAFIVAASQ
jgi:GrpB-like predicted nucleotidyltransferase (UPF0157 family)